MSTTATQDELDQARAALQALAADQPTAVLMAMIEQLVDVACGTNPALRDVMRLRFYRGVLRKLAPLSLPT
jgi:hypothetical protein